ncbi:hypothetical protein A8709_01565 [Paenibacillus pectinilyticus]|uniref:Uncharacterized protein n=1 Tax=Paenibacillus pectinilyticus TaxID=512399 RepID=A0A1C1A6H3_9BACL|nr:hypothetical protein [Paenibacillus pectinilyticus]OCT16160.1 hypothetical protein A8709_01565 [Paenibacillus pectinilyticus]
MVKWAAIVKKDLRLSTTVLFAGLVINVMSIVIAGLVGQYLFIPLLAAAGFHVFYLPIALFASLRTEGSQLHVWLHNPRSAASLLLSKLTSGLATMIVSLAVLYAMAGILLRAKFRLMEAYWTDTWSAGWLIFLHAILISVAIGVWVILLWSLYHAVKHRIGRWSWVVLIGVVLLSSWIDDIITSSSLYKLVTQWGGMEINFPTFSVDPFSLYLGEYFYNLIIVIALFYLSSWIVDRKVEV